MFASLSVLSNDIARLFEQKKRPKVVVVGYGWASAAFVHSVDKSKYDLHVVSTRTKRFNQPQLISLFKPTYTEPPKDLVLTEDECIAVDEQARLISGRSQNYNYDYLVVASGSEPNDYGIPGVKEHCLTFKTEQDLERLVTLLPSVNPINVIGAGPTGIELAIKLKRMGNIVKLIEATPDILPGFSNSMKDIVKATLEQNDIAVERGQKITSVSSSFITQNAIDIPITGPVIWTCGVKPTDFMRHLGKPDEFLSVKSAIFAIGDCATGRGPPTAQNAEQQGLYLAKRFNSDFQGQPYKFTEFARVLDVGDGLLIEKNGYVVKIPDFLKSFVYFVINNK